MKKILLIILTAWIFITYNISISFAIGYNGSSTRAYPVAPFSWSSWNTWYSWNYGWTWLSNAWCTLAAWTKYWMPTFCFTSWNYGRSEYTYFSEFETNTSTTWSLVGINNPFGWTFQVWYNKLSNGDSALWLNLKDFNGNPMVWTWNFIVWTWSSLGVLPNRYVVGSQFQFWTVKTVDWLWTVYLDYYIEAVRVYLYTMSTGEMVFIDKVYLGLDWYPNWLYIWRNLTWEIVQFAWTKSLYSFYYFTDPLKMSTNQVALKDFLTKTGSVNNSMLSWLWASSLYATGAYNPSGGGGSSGSWSSGYYNDCSSLDVWCYIAGTATRFADAWVEAKDNVIAWLFPDINFAWSSETCIENVGSGTLSITGSSLGFVQKVTNLFVIAIPTAPPAGTVCTLDWPKTLAYSHSTPNIIDIFLILICVLPIFFFSGALSPKKSV